MGSNPIIGTLRAPALIRVVRFAAVWANPDAFGVVDSVVARAAIRAHRKHSSAPAGDLALFRGSIVRGFATLIFLSHTFSNTTAAGCFAMNNGWDRSLPVGIA